MNSPHRLDHAKQMLDELMERIKTHKTPKYCVYLITVNGKGRYIGHTKQKLNVRLLGHKHYNAVHTSFWGEYIAEQFAAGADIKILPLAHCATKALALDKEGLLIGKYLASNCELFNRNVAGKLTLDSKRRMSAAKRGLPRIAYRQIYDETTNTMYPSIHDAARELNMLPSSISNAIRHGCKNHGHLFRAIH